MGRLFVETLAVPALDAENATTPRYDEALGYNVTEDGEPYVLFGPQAATITQTYVSQESDDRDADPTVTTTKVQTESDDRD